jgi:hypothetical protein
LRQLSSHCPGEKDSQRGLFHLRPAPISAANRGETFRYRRLNRHIHSFLQIHSLIREMRFVGSPSRSGPCTATDGEYRLWRTRTRASCRTPPPKSPDSPSPFLPKMRRERRSDCRAASHNVPTMTKSEIAAPVSHRSSNLWQGSTGYVIELDRCCISGILKEH